MKHLFCFFIALLVIGRREAFSKSSDSCLQYSIGELTDLVKYISHDSFRGRHLNEGATTTMNLIRDSFVHYGLSPLNADGFFLSCLRNSKTPSEVRHCSVLAVLPGTKRPNEVVIFMANYDHLGTSSDVDRRFIGFNFIKGDTVFNGANDNATGIVALLSMARYFSCKRTNERTIIFIAYKGIIRRDAIELAHRIDDDKVVTVMNLTMLGRPSRITNMKPYVTGSRFSNLLDILNSELRKGGADDDYFRPDLFEPYSLFNKWGNYPFAQRGIPAHTISFMPPTDKLYLSLDDEWDTIDYANLHLFISKLISASKGLIRGNATPDRLRIR